MFSGLCCSWILSLYKTSFSFIHFLQRYNDVQLMSTILEVYAHIFSSILKQNQQDDQTKTLLDQVPESQRSMVKDKLQALQQMMEHLKKHLKQQNREREEVMARLKTIKVRSTNSNLPAQRDFY